MEEFKVGQKVKVKVSGAKVTIISITTMPSSTLVSNHPAALKSDAKVTYNTSYTVRHGNGVVEELSYYELEV